jgi:hypothetical protein
MSCTSQLLHQEYHDLTHKDGVPFVPDALWKDLIFSSAILAAVAICAVVFGPYGPGGQPDPTIIQTVPKPDFFFLWLYAVLSYLPPSLETPFILIAPVVGICILLALPFVASEGEKSWHRRPVAVLVLVTVAVAWVSSRISPPTLRGVRRWMPGVAIRFQRRSSTAQCRSSCRARWSFKPSSAATVMQSAARAACADRHSIPWRRV